MHLVKTAGLHGLEACEVAIIGHNRVDAVLAAERSNLRVEHQISVRITLESRCDEVVEKLRARPNELATRGGNDPLDERGGLGQGGWWIEYAPVGDDPHELGDAEDRQSPALHALG